MAKIKRSRSSYVLIAGLLGLMIVGVLVTYQIYDALTKSQISQRQKVEIIPLDGSISQKTIDNLQARRRFGAAEFDQIVLNVFQPSSKTEGGNLSSP